MSISLSQTARVPALNWLVLVALCWSQLAFAAHQFEHHADEVDSTCATCVQFDRNGDGLVGASQLPCSPAAAIAVYIEPSAGLSAEGFRHYNARASP